MIETDPLRAVDLAPRRRGGLRLRSPILIASGGAGYGNELLAAVGSQLPGAIVTRSTTLDARPGAPPPRLAMAPRGLLSSVGLDNPGIDVVLRRQAPRWAAADVPILVSICADNAEDIAVLAGVLDVQPGVAGIELNLSCPDRGRRGLPIELDIEASETATVSARAATDLPLVVKLGAGSPDVRAVARAVAAAGADAIAAIDGLAALGIHGSGSGTTLGSGYGRLSGPALRPVGLRVVYEIAQVLRIPIIGVGGVSTLRDVLDYLAAGASAVGLATAALGDPRLPAVLASELAAWCRASNLSSYREAIGTALPRRRDRGSLRSGPYRT